MSDRTAEERRVREATEDACACGGGGPGDCCPACEAWHGWLRLAKRDGVLVDDRQVELFRASARREE